MRWKVQKERAGYSVREANGMRGVERLRILTKQSTGEKKEEGRRKNKYKELDTVKEKRRDERSRKI
jgi:hypothetical protein